MQLSGDFLPSCCENVSSVTCGSAFCWVPGQQAVCLSFTGKSLQQNWKRSVLRGVKYLLRPGVSAGSGAFSYLSVHDLYSGCGSVLGKQCVCRWGVAIELCFSFTRVGGRGLSTAPLPVHPQGQLWPRAPRRPGRGEGRWPQSGTSPSFPSLTVHLASSHSSWVSAASWSPWCCAGWDGPGLGQD